MWQIEETKERLAACRDCNRRIERGTHRFGSYDLDRWYHLECAAVRGSRAFAPFAQEAAALMQRPLPATRTEHARNLELEARLLAQPDDLEIRAVFADWLQSIDDPWGELIALELGGRDARTVLKAHFDELIGDFSPRMLEWRHGFIYKATLDVLVPSTNANHILEALFALRTAMLLRELRLPLYLREDAMTVLAQAPRTLRHLFMWFTYDIRLLALPHLEQLTIYKGEYATIEIEAIAPLLAATRLPNVTRLKICGLGALPVPVLAALLDSNLVKQLRWLEITDGTLDGVGQTFIARRRAALAHIPVLNFSVPLDDVFPEQTAAWLARAAEH